MGNSSSRVYALQAPHPLIKSDIINFNEKFQGSDIQQTCASEELR